MSHRHRFSNSKKLREHIRYEAQYRTWQEVPLGLRIQILEQVIIIIEHTKLKSVKS
jgi:hypothetical protein